jgi:hypothetical protein
MIAHVSIPSKNPKETALFFAAIIDGIVFDFPVVAGASIAVAKDQSGLAIEVYPINMAHHPGQGENDLSVPTGGPATLPWEDQIYPEQDQPRPTGFHVALSSKLSETEIIQRAKKFGWRTISCDRGGVFKLIEVWIDNKFLVEILIQEELKRYQSFMNPQGCLKMFGTGIEPESVSDIS